MYAEARLRDAIEKVMDCAMKDEGSAKLYYRLGRLAETFAAYRMAKEKVGDIETCQQK